MVGPFLKLFFEEYLLARDNAEVYWNDILLEDKTYNQLKDSSFEVFQKKLNMLDYFPISVYK